MANRFRVNVTKLILALVVRATRWLACNDRRYTLLADVAADAFDSLIAVDFAYTTQES